MIFAAITGQKEHNDEDMTQTGLTVTPHAVTGACNRPEQQHKSCSRATGSTHGLRPVPMNDRPPIPTRWVRAAATDQRQAQQGMFLTAESRRGSDKLANDAYAISLTSAVVADGKLKLVASKMKLPTRAVGGMAISPEPTQPVAIYIDRGESREPHS